VHASTRQLLPLISLAASGAADIACAGNVILPELSDVLRPDRALRTIVSAEAAKQSVFDLGLPAVSQD
jgi:hypothetical protein